MFPSGSTERRGDGTREVGGPCACVCKVAGGLTEPVVDVAVAAAVAVLGEAAPLRGLELVRLIVALHPSAVVVWCFEVFVVSEDVFLGFFDSKISRQRLSAVRSPPNPL